jgi:hypothetical protein
VKDLLASYTLLDKVVAYVKDEGGNLSTLAKVFTFVVTCMPFALATPWQVSCFGRGFNKACQYACHLTLKCVLGFKRLV